MKCVKTDGTIRNVRPFEALCGVRFKSIEITYEDSKEGERFWNWLRDIASMRITPDFSMEDQDEPHK